MSDSQRRFRVYLWAALVYNLGVMVWGAFVRASGSGAGCGEHWPTCNGEVIPQAPAVETLIEFVHRATSGVSLITALVLVVWAFRAWPRGSGVRRGAVASMVFMLGEAAVGAAIVLLGKTGNDDSVGRAVVMGVHLVNTLLLLGAWALTGWFARGGGALRLWSRMGGVFSVGIFGLVLLGASGAVTALGDTLFPADSLAAGIQQDLSPTAHILVRLRVIHPLFAVAVAAWMLMSSMLVSLGGRGPAARRAAWVCAGLIIGQLVVGGVNLLLLVPIWTQLLHLLVAYLVWLAYVWLAAMVLGGGGARPDVGVLGTAAR